GGSGEPDERECVRDERLAAEHDVPTDHTADHGDDRAGTQRVRHEVVVEELADVVGDVPRQRGGHHGRLWACVVVHVVDTVVVRVVETGVEGARVGLAHDHGTPVDGVEHLDLVAVQPAERGTGDDLLGRTAGRAPTGEVHDPVEVRQDGV